MMEKILLLKDPFTMPGEVGDLADEIAAYANAVSSLQLDQRAETEVLAFLEKYSYQQDDLLQRVGALSVQLYDESDVPVSVISALEGGLYSMIDHAGEIVENQLRARQSQQPIES